MFSIQGFFVFSIVFAFFYPDYYFLIFVLYVV